MVPFRSDEELSAFVEELLEYFRQKEHVELVDHLAHARRFRSISSSEFLNEVDLALRYVLSHRPKDLSAEREDEIRQTVRRIDDAFRSGGGGDLKPST